MYGNRSSFIEYRGLVWYDQCIVLKECFKWIKCGGGMMARITKEQVKHVAHLARLSVSEDDVEQFTEQLDAIIGFAEQLNELDTKGVEPTTHVLDVKNVLREDVVKESLDLKEVIKNAPDEQDGQVKVPSILE